MKPANVLLADDERRDLGAPARLRARALRRRARRSPRPATFRERSPTSRPSACTASRRSRRATSGRSACCSTRRSPAGTRSGARRSPRPPRRSRRARRRSGRSGPDLPAPLLAAVDRALALDPAKRPSAAKLARAAPARARRARPRRRSRSAAQLERALRCRRSRRRLRRRRPRRCFRSTRRTRRVLLARRWPRRRRSSRRAAALALALAVPVLPLGNVALALALALRGASRSPGSRCSPASPSAGSLPALAPLLRPARARARPAHVRDDAIAPSAGRLGAAACGRPSRRRSRRSAPGRSASGIPGSRDRDRSRGGALVRRGASHALVYAARRRSLSRRVVPPLCRPSPAPVGRQGHRGQDLHWLTRGMSPAEPCCARSSTRSSRSSRASSDVRSARTSSPSSSRASSPRRWTTARPSPSRGSTSRTSTRSSSRPTTGSSSRATRSRSSTSSSSTSPSTRAGRSTRFSRRRGHPRTATATSRSASSGSPRAWSQPSGGPKLPERAPSATMIYRPRGRSRRRPRRRRSSASSARSSSLHVNGRKYELTKQQTVIGRCARLRHPDRGPGRLAAARGGAPGGNRVLDRRPRLDERARGERAAHAAREARPRRQDHDRLDRDLVPPRRCLMLASVEVQTVLLVLKICFLVLLYLFIWRIVRSATRDVRMPQESFILAPSQAAAAGLRRAPAPVTTGRAGRGQEPGARATASGSSSTRRRSPSAAARRTTSSSTATSSRPSHHARVEPRRDGVWVEDIGSTNGTYVNGTRLDRPQRLAPGDVVRVGETDLRYETVRIAERRRHAHRAQAPAQRGRLRRRAAALRDRGRDGRRARGRGRLGARRCGAQGGRGERQRRGARRRADPGGEPQRLRALERGRRRRRHGDDDHRRAGRRPGRDVRARRRLARLRAARRRARAAHRRPLARRGARARAASCRPRRPSTIRSAR